MAGQVTVTIGDKQWSSDLATMPWELTQGLGGIPGIPLGTGMLFDLGFEQAITVTTEPMLFPLDIAFFSESLVVTEVYRNVQPGYLVHSTVPARYFMEVNTSELDGVENGSQAVFDYLAPVMVVAASDWVSPMVSFMGFTFMAVFMVALVGDFTGSTLEDRPTRPSLLPAGKNKPEPSYCLGSGQRCATCDKISPRDYGVLSWVGAPVPDYSFAVEPETKDRKIDEVLKRLKEGVDGIQQSENFRQFLLTMSKFHDYSIGNLILIMLQKPDATRVAGFSTWKDLYRWVKKGEKGIAILAPCMPAKGKKPAEPERTETEGEEPKDDEEIRPIYFRVVYVFENT